MCPKSKSLESPKTLIMEISITTSGSALPAQKNIENPVKILEKEKLHSMLDFVTEK